MRVAPRSSILGGMPKFLKTHALEFCIICVFHKILRIPCAFPFGFPFTHVLLRHCMVNRASSGYRFCLTATTED